MYFNNKVKSTYKTICRFNLNIFLRIRLKYFSKNFKNNSIFEPVKQISNPHHNFF